MEPKDDSKEMTAYTFLNLVAAPIVDELKSIAGLKELVTNSAVIGAHAEAVVRRLVRRIVHPLRVSTGAVISEHLCRDPENIPQLDTIIWQPCPAPAIYEIDDFGIVPRGSSMGIMEIKRSNYTGVGSKLKERLNPELVWTLVADALPVESTILNPNLYPTYPALGVVCLRESGKKDSDLDELIADHRCVVILENQDDQLAANPEAVYRLVNFLIRIRQRGLFWDGKALINMEHFNSQPNYGTSSVPDNFRWAIEEQPERKGD
jgi:hypothetical protein